MSSDFDAIVIGGGPAGEVCAGKLADGGLRVALVERELVGGECSFWGCIPSKTLLRPGEARAAARNAPGAREAVTGPLDAAAAFGWRDYMVSDHHDAGHLPWLEEKGIELVRGSGRLDGPGTVVVGEQRLTGRHVVIATGSEPVVPPVPGLRELEGLWTNREATAVTEVPRRLLILGAGAVGVEIGQALNRMRAEVVIVEGMEHALPREPRPLGEALGEALAADGIELRFGQYASAARREDGDYVLDFPDGTRLRGDRLFVATGRRARTGGLGLDTAGVTVSRRGIEVDARMAAGDGVWAIGDVTGIWPLTYVGKYQGRIAAANILGEHREAAYDAVPRIVFTDPQAAAVGAADGAQTGTVAMRDVPRTATYTRAFAQHKGFLTLVSDGERLTGAYALAPQAGEWLQQATLAIRAGVPLPLMRDTIQPFPAFSEAFVDALADLGAQVPAAA